MISVVISAYNAKRYLGACVDSILDNDMTEARILIVDDGSTDGSSRICDAFMAKHADVQAIHRENGGSPAARNTGVAAIGKPNPDSWVWFVDSDDVVAPGAMGALRRLVSETDADAVYFGYVPFDDGNEPDWTSEQSIERKTLSREMFLSGTYSFQYDHYLWRFLFRSTALERFVAWRVEHGMTGLCDESYSLLEDLVFIEEIMQGACESVEIVPDVLYGYRQIGTSMSRATSPKAADSALRAVRYIDQFNVAEMDWLPKQCMQIALLFNAYRAAGQSKDASGLRIDIKTEIEERVRRIGGVFALPRRLIIRYLALKTGLGDLVLHRRGRMLRAEEK
ncbi:MAG: glycosyltransferase family 2 protein [Eggerthellaceae bacterium]|nr:glycosyltransferase family 2 protein [Eggerthellaceae bacterium]